MYVCMYVCRCISINYAKTGFTGMCQSHVKEHINNFKTKKGTNKSKNKLQKVQQIAAVSVVIFSVVRSQ